jgi:hypothetical protein
MAAAISAGGRRTRIGRSSCGAADRHAASRCSFEDSRDDQLHVLAEMLGLSMTFLNALDAGGDIRDLPAVDALAHRGRRQPPPGVTT